MIEVILKEVCENFENFQFWFIVYWTVIFATSVMTTFYPIKLISFFLQVDITEVSDEYKTFAALPSEEIGNRLWLPLRQREVTLAHPDPRLEQFGWRVIARDGSEVLAGTKQISKF